MNIPKVTRQANTEFDRWVQEQKPGTKTIRFFKPAPVAAQLLATIRLERATLLTKIAAALGNGDPTLIGFIRLWMSNTPQIPGPLVDSVITEQVLWEVGSNATTQNVITDLAPHYIYAEAGTSWYFYIESDLAGTNVGGSIVLHTLQTYK